MSNNSPRRRHNNLLHLRRLRQRHEQAGVLVEKGLSFELKAHTFVAFFEVAQKDDMAWLVEDFFDNASTLLITLVVL